MIPSRVPPANDVIDGGPGNDTITTGSGNDVILLALGPVTIRFGIDAETPNFGTDEIKLVGLTPGDIYVSELDEGFGYSITIKATGETLTVNPSQAYTFGFAEFAGINRILFADGTMLESSRYRCKLGGARDCWQRCTCWRQ